MKLKTRLLLIGLIFIFSVISSFAQEINIDGIYAGKNLIVLNPSSGDGYCVTEVWVNGQKTHDEIISNSFEIDFPNRNRSLSSKWLSQIMSFLSLTTIPLNIEHIELSSTELEERILSSIALFLSLNCSRL